MDADDFKTVTAAVTRALSGGRDVELHYSAKAPLSLASLPAYDTMHTLVLPPIDGVPPHAARGSSDQRAVMRRYHMPRLYQQAVPADAAAAGAFAALEQARCEALAMRNMAGIKQNLNALLAEDTQRQQLDTLENREDLPEHRALYYLSRTALSGEDVPPALSRQHALWSGWMQEKLGDTWADDLSAALGNPRDFGVAARAVLRALGYAAPEPAEEHKRDNAQTVSDHGAPSAPPDGRETGDDQKISSYPDNQPGDEDEEDSENAAGQDSDPSGEDDDENGNDGAQALSEEDEEAGDGESEGKESAGQSAPPDSREHPGFMEPSNLPGHGGSYLIYTTQFDEIIDAENLSDPEELARLREVLDRQLKPFQGVVTRLANRLQRKLLARQQRSWQFDLDEGVLDFSRLSRVVADPNMALSYKIEKETDFRDTVVSILIDNSGSMRGRPIVTAALCADILTRTLERCGIPSEILGFTTRAWKGGASRDLWMKSGHPFAPGRLNDLRHIIYKPASQPWRRKRNNLGLMLKEGILKENIDGEALAWAHNRLAGRPEERKILIVISDGAPVDDSTLSVNPANLLEIDLHNVIRWIEDRSDVELAAIGIGHDVTRYYSRALTISSPEELGKAMIDQLGEIFHVRDKKRRARAVYFAQTSGEH